MSWLTWILLVYLAVGLVYGIYEYSTAASPTWATVALNVVAWPVTVFQPAS